MCIESIATASRLEEFESHLKTARYAAAIRRRYLWIAQRFVDYLGRKCIAVEAARAPEHEEFLRSDLRSWRRRHGRNPRDIFEWRRRYKTALNMFLRLVHGHWPVAATPVTAIEAFHRDLVQGYDAWMRDLRGLASVTRSTRTTQALVFLTELGPRGEQASLSQLGVRDIDAYLQQRCKGWRRQTIEGYTVCLRSFLRYLHGSGRTALDLSSTVIGPRIYDDEQIPSALRPEEVQTVVEAARHREVFLQLRAPYQAYKSGSILNCVIGARLKMAGIAPCGRKGPHAFRHARAVSLLRAAVPLKIIGDVLGHRSAESTAVYLKLATEDLRAVGLNIPKEVLP